MTLPYLIRLFQEHVRIEKARGTLPERFRKSSIYQCNRISDPAFKRPDPMIYSQQYLMNQGLAVTWDNPDIELVRNGQVIPSHLVDPSTEYDIKARIWNTSKEAPIVDLRVKFFYVSFGIGTVRHAIGETKVNLGVRGGANHPAFAFMKWRTPATAGHYCIQVVLEWTDDANPNNNLGQENIQVLKAHSPVEFIFQLYNNTQERQLYYFNVDSYNLPKLQACDEMQKNPREEQRLLSSLLRQVPGTITPLDQDDPRNYPLPEGWTVQIEPDRPLLNPSDEITIKAIITPPNNFSGIPQPININAFHSHGFAGGVTAYVER